MLFPKPASPKAQTRAWVVYFANPEWGFSDSALPKLNEFIQRFPELRCRTTHSSLTAYFDTENVSHYLPFVDALKVLAAEPEFEDFRIGVAEGLIDSPMGFHSLEMSAARTMKQKEKGA